MNQCSPVADHSLREALSCHVSIETHTWKSTKIHYGQQIGREKGGREKCVPGDLLRHCAKYRRLKRKGKNVHRATYCAIARSTDASNGRERMCTGRPTAPLREVPTHQTEGKECAPGDLLRHCAKYRRLKRKGKMCTGRPTAPVITRYRCFLPDLAGLAGLRRVGPGTGTILSPKTAR
jgi:hypothetical protein